LGNTDDDMKFYRSLHLESGYTFEVLNEMQNIKVNGIEYDDSYKQKYYDALKVMDYFDAMKWIDFKMYVEYNQSQFAEPNKLMEVPIQFMSKLRFDLS
jgi:hypothetical protein